jgi:hypothetical protein
MRRVLVAACGFALAGCSSSSTGWLPSMSLGGGGTALRLESEPSGAEAVTAAGPGCRTPCAVTVPVRETSVTFNLPGYLPQTVPVRVDAGSPGTDTEFATTSGLAPNPVFAQLEPAPPAAPAKKKAKAKPRTAKVPAASTSSDPAAAPPAQRTIPGAQPTSPASQRAIPGSAPTAPPASAWPPPAR